MRKSRDSRRCGPGASLEERTARQPGWAGLHPLGVLKPVRDGLAFIHPLAGERMGLAVILLLHMQRASEATPSSCLWETRSNSRSDPGGSRDGYFDVSM